MLHIPRSKIDLPPGLNPINLEIIRHGLQAIPDEIETDITRTAYSPLIYEYKDYAVGLVDVEGQLIAHSRGGIPIFMANVLGLAVLDGLECYDRDEIRPGDVFMSNWSGTFGQHLNNVTMYTPVFADRDGKNLVAFMAVLTHWMDVGGRYVGSSASNDTTDIWQEGIQFRSVKIRSQGKPVPEIYRIVEVNTRFPEMVLGDLAAQLAACIKGKALYEELLVRHGLDLVTKATHTIWKQSAEAARAAVQSIPDGRYSATSFLDDDGVDKKPVHFDISVEIQGERFIVDYTEINDQVRGPFNSGRFGGGISAARLAFKYLTTPNEMTNQGSFEPLEVILPDGKILSARPGAPLARYSSPMPTVIDTIIKALAPAVPARVAAAHHGQAGSHRFHGFIENGRRFSNLDTAHGGWGASHDMDGPGPFKTLAHGDTHDVPVEMQEALYPIRIDHVGFITDSGGAGQYRGGPGVEKRYTILHPCWLTVTFVRHDCPAWGLLGGKNGAPASVELDRDGKLSGRLLKVNEVSLAAGDLVTLYTGGGGGYGSPLERDPEAVAADIKAGLVSVKAAASIYGVILDEEKRINENKTLKTRRALTEGGSAA
jgi:N-methylhydantoinase B